MPEDRADAFLRMIRRSQRGRLKIFLGYSAGVGKTYQMLQEGHRLRNEGIDVVIGLLETHGRAEIIRLAEGLEVVPRRAQEYHGIAIEEMDADAVIARKPTVALVDELAILLTAGQLPAAARTTIVNYTGNTANIAYTTGTDSQKANRLRAIVHLIATSPDFTIQR